MKHKSEEVWYNFGLHIFCVLERNTRGLFLMKASMDSAISVTSECEVDEDRMQQLLWIYICDL